jgi:hypothetical protein
MVTTKILGIGAPLHRIDVVGEDATPAGAEAEGRSPAKNS